MQPKAAKNTTDVLELLASQHEEVDALIERIQQGNGDRARLLLELADQLSAHATVEETIFYPAVMTAATSDKLHESVEEHLQIKRLLADLLAVDPDDDESFDAKLEVLGEEVSHHAHEEEETKLFPMLRKAFSADQLAAIGNETLAKFEELMTDHPSENVPAETDVAAPLPPT